MTFGRTRNLVAALAVALLTSLVFAATPATAHADFLSSSPSPCDIWNIAPSSVRVTVSEAVQSGSPTIVVTNTTGVRVDRGPAFLSPTDPATFTVALASGIGPSVYAVTWGAIAADDGHFTAGTFYFMIEYRNGTLPGRFPQSCNLSVAQPISPTEVGLQAAGFVALSIAFGASLVAGLLWIPYGSGLEGKDQTAPAEGLRALLRFARWGALVLAAAATGLWAENLLRSPLDPLGAAGSVFLLSVALQGALGLAILYLLTHLLARPNPMGTGDRPWEFLPILFCGFAVILAEAAASHSSSVGGWWPLGPVADAVHLYGAALWVGGLLALVRVRPWLRAPIPAAFSEGLLRAFSNLALLGALLVVSAGALLAFILVGTVGGLLGSSYGWVVLAKVSLLVPMILLGAWNRHTLRPDRTDAASRAGVERVSQVVRAEAVLGGVVLVLAALLVTMNPVTAPPPESPTFTLDATVGGLYGIFQMNPWPATPGDYIFQLTAYYAGNMTPYGAGGNGTIGFLLVGGNGSWVTVPLEGPHANHYFVPSGVLNAAGTWQIRAEIAGPLGTPVDFAFTIAIHP